MKHTNLFTPTITKVLVTLLCLGLCTTTLHAQDADWPTDVAVTAHYPPLNIEGDPDRPGLAVEILTTAAQRLNRRISVEFQPFQRVLYSMSQRPDVLTPVLFRTEQREDQFTWIAPILSDNLRFMTFGPAINTLEDAKKLGSVAVEAGSTSSQVLEREGFENLVYVSTPEASIQMLEAQRVDAWFQAGTAGEAVMKEFNFEQDLTFGDIVHSVRAYLAGAKGFPADVAQLYHEAILGMHSDGTIKALQEKYRPRSD